MLGFQFENSTEQWNNYGQNLEETSLAKTLVGDFLNTRYNR